MAVHPYHYPRSCERETLAEKLAKLDRQQVRVLRAYIYDVEFGSRLLKEWLGTEFAVSETVWRKPYSKGGRYYGTEIDGNPDFRAALLAYRTAYIAYESAREEEAVRKAASAYRLAAPKAAEVHIGLMENANDERVRLQAASEVADRASKDTARKGEVSAAVGSIEEWRKEADRRRAEVAAMLAGWAEEPEEPAGTAGAGEEDGA